MTSEELKKLEEELWRSADTLRGNSDLTANEYSTPVLGIIFLRFADNIYSQYEKEILAEYEGLKGGRRERSVADIALEKCGFYLPQKARYDYLLNLPEQEDIAKAVKEAMQEIENHKPELRGVLPQDEYARLTRTDNSIPKTLLKNFSNIPKNITGDLFGQIYEYFLGNFALAEGQGGGEFFTPRSVVRLMVEMIEPTNGTVFDPACGSGGMFVQSAQFRNEHKPQDDEGFFVYGQEKRSETIKLAKMNLAVNGLRGEVKQAISYYEDPFDSMGKFDYVLANPPFNVDDVSYSRIKDDKRFSTYGIPRKKSKAKEDPKEAVPNANYLWINLFATSLNDKGRAALVMANSASDARHSEAEIRQTLVEKNLIYAMITLPSNMFYTVTLPATLWFFDKAKEDDKVLFIDARNIYTQIDRAHREFSAEQVKNIAVISQLHKGNQQGFIDLIDSYFASGMKNLQANQRKIKPLTEQLEKVLEDNTGKTAAHNLQTVWDDLSNLETSYTTYQQAVHKDIASHNKAQHTLRQTFNPFFDTLHKNLKQLDKTLREHEKEQKKTDQQTRQLKAALEELHKDAKDAESYYKHISWLQERFPEASYEDVTGLCKRADPQDIKEQDYSLNPGRYVGVVIEEDGKTEEEFLQEILNLNDELETLNSHSTELKKAISENIKILVGQ